MKPLEKQQKWLLYKLLHKFDEKYLTRESICKAILTNDQGRQDMLDLIDSVGNTALTALRFRDYHRAARYVAFFARLCEKYGAMR